MKKGKKVGIVLGLVLLMGIGTLAFSERAQRLFFEIVDIFYFSSPSLAETIPHSFNPPLEWNTPSFRARPLLSSDYKKDYEAVMESRSHLVGLMGPEDTWPEKDLTLTDNYLQLLRHEREFSRRHGFTYTVESLDGKTTIGCIYIVPARRPDFQAEVFYWVRAGERLQERDRELGVLLVSWLKEKWPFTANKVAFPGRKVAWDLYLNSNSAILSENP